MPAAAPLNSTELYALGSGINICCNETVRAYTEASRQKTHPAQKKGKIDKVTDCVDAVRAGAEAHCSEEYDALKNCLLDNKRSWVKCQDVKRVFDLCLVKNKLGELAR
mmetsp:Transcript_15267/g.22370  ORF Transcript_15267/g.22370 Transcript_15267/m.22370 type:complete len:108 (-) Transcript_15267:292-615(-)